MKKIFKKAIFWKGTAILTIATLIAVILTSLVTITYQRTDSDIPIIGQQQITIFVGTEAHAAGTADYTCDGIDDNVQFQAVVDALPAGGGQIIALAGTYNFSATVTRAIANVRIVGTGRSTIFNYNGVNPIFTAGGNNWTFDSMLTDAGGIDVGATTGWEMHNVMEGATYYAYRCHANTNSVLGLVTLNEDVTTDRWLNQNNNTFLGVHVVGGDALAHGAGDEGYYNSAFGHYAMYSMTTGMQNCAFGHQSLMDNTTGYANSAYGYRSLWANTTGYGSSAFGITALMNNTTAIYNAAFGFNAQRDTTTGNWNAAFGTTSLRSNTTGYSNTGCGMDTLYTNTTGYQNTAVGLQSFYLMRATSGAITAFADAGGGQVTVTSAGHGQGNGTTVQISGTINYNGSYVIANVAADTFEITHAWAGDDAIGWWGIDTEARRNTALGTLTGFNCITGQGNIFIGFQAGYNETGSNKLYIDNSNTATPLIYGDMSTDEVTINGIHATAIQTETLGVGAATFVADRNIVILTGDGGGNNVTTITGGVAGQILTIIFTDANVTMVNNDAHGADTLDLNGNLVSADDTVLMLVYDGTSWYEISRSVN